MFKIKNIIVVIGLIFLVLIIILFTNNKSYKEKYNSEADPFIYLSYEIPEYFEDSDSSSLYKLYNYNENRVYCNISITTLDYYDDAQKAINNITIKASDVVSEIKEIDLNGNLAYTREVESADKYVLGKNYYYMFKIKNHIYSIEYEIRDYEKGDRGDSDTNKCFLAREKFINSIVVK